MVKSKTVFPFINGIPMEETMLYNHSEVPDPNEIDISIYIHQG